MSSYSALETLLRGVRAGSDAGAWRTIIDYLGRTWLDDYEGSNDIVETKASDFSYLFDVGEQRLIAAYGISRGRHGAKRDSSRMAGHPLGGGTDINLVPQLGRVNIGPFRELERRAVATPGAFYFTRWYYAGAKSQMPNGVDQGLLIPGAKPELRMHVN